MIEPNIPGKFSCEVCGAASEGRTYCFTRSGEPCRFYKEEVDANERI